MVKKIKCTECGAININDEKTIKEKCNFCGSVIDITKSEIAEEKSSSETALNATSFVKSLDAEVNGGRASIAVMWDALISNKSTEKEKLIAFCKNLKDRIRFCIEVYQNLSNEEKYEVGDFICTQMESLIDFRLKNNLAYLDDRDDIMALINQQKYDIKARGIFQFKAKSVIKKRIKRIEARLAVLEYDYVTIATNYIITKYNSKIEPLQSELNSTAKTAFGRRKELKEKINSYEIEKKIEIDALGLKEKTKKYNKVVKKYKIEHENQMAHPTKEFIPGQFGGSKKDEIDYETFSMVELLNELVSSIDKIKIAVTKSESDKVKKIKTALESKVAEVTEENVPYLNAITMSIDTIFTNENPATMSLMINAQAGNIIMQANTLKSKLK